MLWHFTGYWLKDAVAGEWRAGGLVVSADTEAQAVRLFWDTFYATPERHRLVRGVRLDGRPAAGLESVHDEG